MMASALLEQLNQAIDQQQMVIRNHVASFKYNDIVVLQQAAKSIMQLMAEEGDRNLTKDEQVLYAIPVK